jgi:peptidoglycan-associated lipoprotein
MIHHIARVTKFKEEHQEAHFGPNKNLCSSFRAKPTRERRWRQSMRNRNFGKFSLLCSFLVLVAAAAGCGKKVAATPPAPPPRPPAAQPTVTMTATPSTVNPGQTVTLSWSSTSATDLNIAPGVGAVATQGSTPVTPTTSTTYTITATGSGGSATATARVNVNAPVANNEAPPPVSSNVSDMFNQSVKDIYFDLDKSEIASDSRDILTKDAEFLRNYPQVRISLEGHCDERGSTEYNLGLGQRRAEAAKNYLVSVGISADRIETVSWGKERPVCTVHDESCWHQNRRAHFVMAH